MTTEIDIKKDYLVISRNAEGEFLSFHWYHVEKHTEDELKDIITKWNEEHKVIGRQAELITDQLVREICAYREHSLPLEYLRDDVKELREWLGKTRENLQDALCELDRIKEIE